MPIKPSDSRSANLEHHANPVLENEQHPIEMDDYLKVISEWMSELLSDRILNTETVRTRNGIHIIMHRNDGKKPIQLYGERGAVIFDLDDETKILIQRRTEEREEN